MLAQREAFTEADSLLESGESLVVDQPAEHAKFFGKKGQVLFMQGDREGAESTLQQVEELVASLQVDANSEPGRVVTSLRRLLQT